jgi:cell division protein FtsL
MAPEEQKIFNEFKIALDATQVETHRRYVQPEIEKIFNYQVEKLGKLEKRLNVSLWIIMIQFIIIIILLLTNLRIPGLIIGQ